MDTYTLKICPLTQSPERFICLNQECWSIDKKQLQCYECLNKQHIGKNKTIRHLDDVIDIDKFMKQIQEKSKQKEIFLNSLILSCNDFQKEKIQQIELTQKSEIAKMARDRIEKEVTSLVSKLGQDQIMLKSLLLYSQSKHQQLIQCYYDNEQLYIENMKQQYKQLVDKVQTFVFSLDCDIKQQIQKLQEITKALQNSMPKNTKSNYLQHPTLLLVVISLLLSYLINQHHLDLQISQIKLEMNAKINLTNQNLQNLETQMLSEIRENCYNQGKMNETINLFNQEISQVLENFNVSAENIEKLKLRFDVHKKSTSNWMVETRSAIVQINDRVSMQKQDSFEQFNTTSVYLDSLSQQYNDLISDQASQLKSLVNMMLKLNSTVITQILENTEKINSTYTELLKHQEAKDNLEKSNIELQEKQKELDRLISLASPEKQRLYFQNQDLIGKIHQNLSLERLKDFTLIYDNFFTQFISLSAQDRLFKFAKQQGEDPVICLGGLNINNQDKFILAGCDFASEVFQTTYDRMKARKSQYGDIYWYSVDQYSFGFSPKETIFLNFCDDEDLEDDRRFSYWLSIKGRHGGRRIGSEYLLGNSVEHKMQIYLLK